MRDVATNRKASFNYHLLDKVEAGLVLTGSEVKSLRQGGANISEAYAVIKDGEAWLLNAHISPYELAHVSPHEPKRTRKLLLKKHEINKLIGKLNQRGLTLVPTRLYFSKDGYAKIELALAKGKKRYDKREAIKEREMRREIARQRL